MVIGIDATRANKSVKTGTEWYAYHLIQELKKIIPSEVEVRLYSSRSLEGELGALPPHWQERKLGWPLPYLWTVFRLAIEMIVNPPDVLFLPCSGFPLVLPKRTVTTIHDLGFDRFPKAYKQIQIVYHRHAVRRALKHCSAILTVSEFSKREILELYGQGRSLPLISVTPLAINTTRFFFPIEPTKIDEVRARYQLANPYFIFVGRIEERKNVLRMIEAFSLYKQKANNQTEFLLIGPDGKGSGRAAQIGKMASGVRRLPWVESQDLPILLAGAKALLFATLYEGFGIPILEALAVGTPVVTSRGGAHEEVAGQAAIFCDPLDEKDIEHGMVEVDDPIRRKELRQAGLNRVKDFSWEKTGRLTWEVLRGAVSIIR